MTVACPYCDALQVVAEGRDRDGGACFRCGTILARADGAGLRLPLAYVAAGAPLLAAGLVFPALRVGGPGVEVQATVPGAALALFAQPSPAMGALVLITAVLLPALHLAGFADLLGVRAFGGAVSASAPAIGAVFRLVQAIRPWAALEIALVAVVVTSAKLSDVVAVAPGAGLWCLVAFLVLERAAGASFDPRRFWRRMHGGHGP